MSKITLFAATAAILATASPAAAQVEAGDWLIRGRVIVVAPNERSGAVEPGFPGSTVGVENSVMPEVDFTYMVTDHLGAELILATTKHHLNGQGSLSGLDRVGSTWVLPPTLTLQYHLTPSQSVRPYVGAGINYTTFYSSRASDALEAAIGQTNVRMKDSFGYALQAGVDFDIGRNLFVNLDIKYVDMDTTATLTTGASVNRVRVNIDPLIFGAGVGFKF